MLTKTLFFTTFLFFSAIPGWSQYAGQAGASAEGNTRGGKENGDPLKGTLSGTVTERGKGNPVPGATVYIADLKLGVIADSLGHYFFRILPAGTYLVEAHSVGFKTSTKTVTIEGSTVANFELSDEVVEESPVVVTGMSRATQIKRNPVPIVAVDRKFMVTGLSSNIIDAIVKVPGVSALTTGPNVSKPFIRGLGYNRVLTLYDGIRQEGQQWGDEHGIEVDQYGIDRVEVIKGPASLSYGSDALAGVVNLIPTQPAPEGKRIGNVLAEYQTNNGMFGGSAVLGATYKGFEWMGRLSHKEATNYQNPIDGRVFNTGFHETDASLGFGLHRSFGYSHLSLSMFNDLQEIPDGSRDSASRRFTKQITEIDTFRPIVPPSELNSYAVTPLHQHVQHFRAYSNNNFVIGTGRLAVNLGFQGSIRREFSHPEMPETPGLYLQLNTYSYDIKYFFPTMDGWDLSAGINGMYQTNSVTKGTDFVIPSYHQFDLGPFAMVKKSLQKVDLAGGIRFDTRTFHNDELYSQPDPVTGFNRPVSGPDTAGASLIFYNYNHVFSGISGSLGATYNVNEKVSLKANIARGYRSPNISEISSNGVHPGTNIYQLGNTSFKPEFSLQGDIGAAFTSKYLVVTLSLFDNTIQNYIFNERLLSVDGGDSVIVRGNQTFKFQQGKANLYGGEFSLDIHPVRQLHVESVLSAVYALNQGIDPKLRSDSNRYLPFIPPLHGLTEVKYDFEFRHSHIVNAYAKVGLVYYARQDRVYLTNNTETPTPGYALLDAGIGGGFTNKKGKTVLNIYVTGSNLADLAYQDHLSRLKYFEPYPNDPRAYHGIYNMGRNISFKIEFPLDYNTKTSGQQ
jgi:iron complex outermembrane receptor protein